MKVSSRRKREILNELSFYIRAHKEQFKSEDIVTRKFAEACFWSKAMSLVTDEELQDQCSSKMLDAYDVAYKVEKRDWWDDVLHRPKK